MNYFSLRANFANKICLNKKKNKGSHDYLILAGTFRFRLRTCIKHSKTIRLIHSLHSVVECGQTWSFVFDVLLPTCFDGNLYLITYMAIVLLWHKATQSYLKLLVFGQCVATGNALRGFALLCVASIYLELVMLIITCTVRVIDER